VRPVSEGAGATTSTTTDAAPVDVTTTTVAATTTTTTVAGAADDPVRAEVETAYRNAVQAAETAATVPSPDDPRIAEWNTGPMLDDWQNDISALRIQGRVVSFPADSLREIVFVLAKVDGNRAVVTTCEVDDAIVTEVATGQVINSRVVRNRFESVLVRSDRWRLSERQIVDEGGESCPAG